MPAYYRDTVGRFLAEPLDALELTLHKAYESDRYKDLITTQITAWRSQIHDLKGALETLATSKYFNPTIGESLSNMWCPEKWGASTRCS